MGLPVPPSLVSVRLGRLALLGAARVVARKFESVVCLSLVCWARSVVGLARLCSEVAEGELEDSLELFECGQCSRKERFSGTAGLGMSDMEALRSPGTPGVNVRPYEVIWAVRPNYRRSTFLQALRPYSERVQDLMFESWRALEAELRGTADVLSSDVDVTPEPPASPEAPRKSDNTPVMKDVESVSKYAHPAYETLKSREESFARWSHEDKVSAARLASAGFFFTNIEDKVLCFSCGGGLRDWKKGDDGWVEHAFYFSKCRYVKEMKGTEFVRLVQGERPATMTPEVCIFSFAFCEM